MCNQFSKFQSLNEKKIVGINVEEIINIRRINIPTATISLAIQDSYIFSHDLCN